MNTSISHLSGPSLLGTLFLPALREARALRQRSFVLLSKSLEVQGALVDPGDRETPDVQGDLAKTALKDQCLPFDLSLLGSLELRADHHHRQLEVLVVL